MKVLFIGLGNLGAQAFDMFVRVPGEHSFLVAGRNMQHLQERTNLSVLTAMQLGLYPQVDYTYMDLWNEDQVAEIISRFKPDLIFCAVIIWVMSISKLPKPIFERLHSAQIGPWLPMNLTLVYKLMKAVKETGLDIKVINASNPDSVNCVLGRVGLAPTTGIGNVANNVPAIRKSIALKLNKPLEQVEVRFFTAHYVSYRISRYGSSGGAPFHLTALIDGKNMTHLLDMETIFDLLPTTFKRAPGNLMTAASATAVFEGIANDMGKITHAPGPNGLPGGYPVKVSRKGVDVLLPDDLTLEEAIRINEDSQRFDGIEKIDEDGTVYFTDREMSILKETFSYECKRMPLSEVEDRAKELQAKFAEFIKAYQ